MKLRCKEIIITGLLLIALIAGCGGSTRPRTELQEFTAEKDLGATIGSLGEVFLFGAIPVEGYALVGGLNGTGSSECPPQVRAYLEKYILTQFGDQKINATQFINSRDTAVVVVQGTIPTGASKKERFDVKVSALSGTQTTSLRNGQLWGAELREAGKFGLATKVLAKAEGPIFIDTIDTAKTDERVGYVLAGGTVLDEYKIMLALRQPDLKTSSQIRNLLNEHFEPDTAKATSPGQIELKVPAKYKGQKERFISIVRAMHLNETEELISQRIDTFIRKLAVSEDKRASEIALEAIGNKSIEKLAALVNLSNEEVRLCAARCMLHLGDERGLNTLREIAMDKSSAYRLEALNAIGIAARRTDAAATLRRLLRDEDFDVRLAAYEQLRKTDDIAIKQSVVGRDFYLEEIAQITTKGIFASRSGEPRIALFGSPIYCDENIFVQSSDGNITINAPTGEKYVSLIRKHPTRPEEIIQLKCSFEVGDIIRGLCEEPAARQGSGLRPGLGVSYAEAIALLKQMCDKGAIPAEFRAGAPPKID